MAASVLIIDCTDTAYNAQTAPMQSLGGIQRCVLNLATALSKKDFAVGVWNNTPQAIHKDGVDWIPRNTSSLPKYDIVVACNDACLLGEYAKKSGHRAFLPIVWFHNPVRLGKTVRKGRMLSLLRWRPIGIFLGGDHDHSATKLLPLRKRTVIPHGLEEEILQHTSSIKDRIRPPVAVYISQAYRGLDDLVRLWKEKIHTALPQAEFRIYAANTSPEIEGSGVKVMGRISRKELTAALGDARACLIPGHEDETFCLAAAECLAMQIPVVTYGTGALKERVQDGVNGYIVDGREQFADRLLQLLKDDTEWKKLHDHGLPSAQRKSWDQIAEIWTSLFRERGIPC